MHDKNIMIDITIDWNLKNKNVANIFDTLMNLQYM
jgi:hypothetical protein